MTDAPTEGEDQTPPTDPLTGPPGGQVFSLERRPAAGLYLVGWLLSAGGIGLAFIGIQAPPGPGRLLILLGLLVLALGLATAAGYQILARASRPQSAYRGASPVLLFFLAVVVVNLFGAVISLATGRDGLDVDDPAVFLVGLLIQVVVYVGTISLFVLAPRVLSWREMTGSDERSAGRLLADIATGAATMLPVTLVALIVGSIAAVLIDARPPQVVPLPQTMLEAGIDLMAAVILAPIGEELFFRGFALTAWLRDLGTNAAIVRSSLFFALVHVLNVQAVTGEVDLAIRSVIVLLVVLLPIGFVLGWLYARRGLAASISAHMTYNAIIFGLLLLSSLVPPPTG